MMKENRRPGRHANRGFSSGRLLQSRLYRNPRDGWLRGVCAGLGDYFGVPASWFRWGVALSTVFFFFPTVLFYFGAGFLLAERPDQLYGTPEEESFWQGVRVEPERTYSGLAHRFRSMERRLRSIEALITSREFRLSREIDNL